MPVALFGASTGAAAGSRWHVIDRARSLRSSAVVALPDLYRSASRATPRSLVSSVYSDHHNEQVGDPRRKVRFQGLDLYSLRASMDAVVAHLDRVDRDEARRTRDRMNRGRRAERHRRARRRGVLPADVPRRGVVVEPSGPARGELDVGRLARQRFGKHAWDPLEPRDPPDRDLRPLRGRDGLRLWSGYRPRRDLTWCAPHPSCHDARGV